MRLQNGAAHSQSILPATVSQCCSAACLQKQNFRLDSTRLVEPAVRDRGYERYERYERYLGFGVHEQLAYSVHSRGTVINLHAVQYALWQPAARSLHM